MATGTRSGVGSGVDEQFARRRTLWLSAVGATLPLHRRGRDKLGVEDAKETRRRERESGGERERERERERDAREGDTNTGTEPPSGCKR